MRDYTAKPGAVLEVRLETEEVVVSKVKVSSTRWSPHLHQTGGDHFTVSIGQDSFQLNLEQCQNILYCSEVKVSFVLEQVYWLELYI